MTHIPPSRHHCIQLLTRAYPGCRQTLFALQLIYSMVLDRNPFSPQTRLTPRGGSQRQDSEQRLKLDLQTEKSSLAGGKF